MKLIAQLSVAFAFVLSAVVSQQVDNSSPMLRGQENDITQGKSVRSRALTDGPDPRAGKILDCFLVNLASEVEIKLDGDDDYTPGDSSKGWSIYCKSKEPGKVDYVNFFYDGEKSSQYYSPERYSKPWLQPFWMEGDNNGLTVADVNDVDYLATLGPKTVNVKFHTWAGGDQFPGDEKTYYLNGGGGPPPVPSPTPVPVSAPIFIQDIIEDTPTFSTLETAVEIAGLEDLFRSPGPFTVFAPTDAAFEALPQGPLAALLADPLALKDLLLYHVLNGQLPEATLKAISPATLPTLSGDSVAITTVGGLVTINADAKVVDPDNFASNGIVHGIDSVLCNNGGFTCPVGTTPITICPQSEADCACNNGGFVCPPGFDPTSACPLNFATGCVCNNGGFTCPPGSFATNGCPKSIDDCFCGSSFSCPVGTVAVGFCPTGPGDCQCNNGGFACPTGFVPTNECPLSIADCACGGTYSCPTGFTPTIGCPLTIADCTCADTFSCPFGFSATTTCPLDQSDCQCDGSFSCPANSSPVNGCPQSFADCKCDSDFTKEGGQCVEVCNDPQPPNPLDYNCHLFGNLLYPGGSYLGNFETRSPSLQFRSTVKRFRTYVPVDSKLFGRQSFELRYLSESKCAKSRWVFCKNSTPIGLDINNSGAVERIEGSFKIDLSGDGNMELLQEWFAPSEGILISTAPSIKNGRVTGQNMFGDMGHKYEDGYAKLSLLDQNVDNIVSGAELDGLAIWVDANSNALLDEGELFSLEEYNIVGLRTDDDIHYASSAILSDGTEMYMEDLWFTEDMSFTRRRAA